MKDQSAIKEKLDQIRPIYGLSFGHLERKSVERREEEKKKKKKRREGRRKEKRMEKVWNAIILYGNYDFVWISMDCWTFVSLLVVPFSRV